MLELRLRILGETSNLRIIIFDKLLLKVFDLEGNFTVENLQSFFDQVIDLLLWDFATCTLMVIASELYRISKVLDLESKLIFKHLMVLSLLILRLLQLFQVHVQCLCISLNFLDSFDDFLFKYFLALFHLVHFFLNRFAFGRRWGWARSHSSILISTWLLKSLTWRVYVASQSIIIGKLLVCRWHLLSLMIIKLLCAISIELRLVLIAFDHLL